MIQFAFDVSLNPEYVTVNDIVRTRSRQDNRRQLTVFVPEKNSN